MAGYDLPTNASTLLLHVVTVYWAENEATQSVDLTTAAETLSRLNSSPMAIIIDESVNWRYADDGSATTLNFVV